MRSLLAAALTGWLLMHGAPLLAQESDPHLRSVFHHFVAPCCWTESLALHDSPLADSLRDEIRARLAAGETTEQVEQALVARYGARVLSSPPGYGGVAAGLLLLIGLAGVFLVWSHWRAPTLPAAETPVCVRGESDARIDEELRLLEDDA